MSPILTKILRFLAGAAILAVGLMVAKTLIGMKPEAPVSARPVQPRPVKSITFIPGEVVPVTPLEGRVDALNRMEVFAEVNGVLALGGKEFREGTRFREGEVMLRLDDSEPRAALVSQRSQLLQLLSSSLSDLRMDYPESWNGWQAYVNALKVEEALAELPAPKSDRERLFLANRGILSAFHSIRAAEERLAKYEVRAPFSGTLTTATVRPGALVRAGQPLGTLVGESAFEVKSAVHARYLDRIRITDEVTFREESGKVVAKGEVARIASNVDASTQSASVFCHVVPVEADYVLLRDGRYLSGSLMSKAIPDAMSIRLDLIQEDGTLFVIEDGVLVAEPVEVAFRSVDEAIVVGMQAGSQLLAEPVSGAYAGMAVKVAE
jgi:multidrug efflux pump subunit AcrA (membrane-fusion protein)